MLFMPLAAGSTRLPKEVLQEDIKKRVKTGPCAVSERAVYLNGYLVDRKYYLCYEDIERVYKKISMAYGMMNTICYLVVRTKDGEETQYMFMHDTDVDTFLQLFQGKHPEIPVKSRSEEKKEQTRLKERPVQEKKDLSKEAADASRKLQKATEFLEQNPKPSGKLLAAATEKALMDAITPKNQKLGLLLCSILFAVMFVGAGLMVKNPEARTGLYLILVGFAGLLIVAGSGKMLMPWRNRKTAQKIWTEALGEVETYLQGKHDFPLPTPLAHPYVCGMLRERIEQGKSFTVEEALTHVCDELKPLSMAEAERKGPETVAILPLFLTYFSSED